MKKVSREERRKKLMVGVGIGIVVSAAYILGRRTGKADFVQKLIDHYEEGPVSSFDWPVFETRNPEMPDFIYLIKAECLGD
jgi:hypothetical protein